MLSPQEIDHFVERFNDMFNLPDLNIADEIFAPQFVSHLPLAPALDLEAFKAYCQTFYDAFPDLKQQVHDVIVTGSRIVLRVSYHGTHRGYFQGIPPTGRSVDMPGIGIFQVENRQVVENWAEIDVAGLVAQVSAQPAAN